MHATDDLRVRLARERLTEQYGYTPLHNAETHKPRSTTTTATTTTAIPQQAVQQARYAAAVAPGEAEAYHRRCALEKILAEKDAELARVKEMLAVEGEGVLKTRARCGELESQNAQLGHALQQALGEAAQYHKLLQQSEAERDAAVQGLAHCREVASQGVAADALQRELLSLRDEVVTLQNENSRLHAGVGPTDVTSNLAHMQTRGALIDRKLAGGGGGGGGGGVRSPDPPVHREGQFDLQARLIRLEAQLGI